MPACRQAENPNDEFWLGLIFDSSGDVLSGRKVKIITGTDKN